ncbi:MAG: hypothetical protein ACREQF_01295 [Candidatus Binataceae bacterium]
MSPAYLRSSERAGASAFKEIEDRARALVTPEEIDWGYIRKKGMVLLEKWYPVLGLDHPAERAEGAF